MKRTPLEYKKGDIVVLSHSLGKNRLNFFVRSELTVPCFKKLQADEHIVWQTWMGLIKESAKERNINTENDNFYGSKLPLTQVFFLNVGKPLLVIRPRCQIMLSHPSVRAVNGGLSRFRIIKLGKMTELLDPENGWMFYAQQENVFPLKNGGEK